MTRTDRTLSHTLVLYGSSGVLGSSIEAAAHARGHRVLTRSWQDPQNGFPGLLEALGEFAADFVFAGGMTDPATDPRKIREANVELPRQVFEFMQGMQSTRGGPPSRFLTFGTILETFPSSPNPYVQSKIELSRWVESVRRGAQPGRPLHLRLHTLYGGSPKPHMFLAQMLEALAKNQPFRMSAGRQLREYHAAEDVSASVLALLERSWDELDPFLDLSSGTPLQLAELARGIFRSFGKEDLLMVGALATPPVENFGRTFSRSPDWLIPQSRDPLSGIVAWFKDCLQQRTGRKLEK